MVAVIKNFVRYYNNARKRRELSFKSSIKVAWFMIHNPVYAAGAFNYYLTTWEAILNKGPSYYKEWEWVEKSTAIDSAVKARLFVEYGKYVKARNKEKKGWI